MHWKLDGHGSLWFDKVERHFSVMAQILEVDVFVLGREHGFS